MATIHQRIEPRRGCGYRKPGGLYFVGAATGAPCCRLPIPLTVCPCCGEGIKQARGFTWISPQLLGDPLTCACPMAALKNNLGLLWVGEKFYPTTREFTRESETQGISKRIACVPRDFVIGKHWIALAHRRAVVKFTTFDESITDTIRKSQDFIDRATSPGIFQMFKPIAVDYIITRKESNDELNALEDRGYTLIDVIRDVDAQTKTF